MNVVKRILEPIVRYISGELQSARERRQYQATLNRRAVYKQAVFNFMCAIRMELAVIFTGNNYACIEKVYSPYHLRIVDYRENNGARLYIFSIAKQTREQIPTFFLPEIRQNMNRDIYAYYHELVREAGIDFVRAVYPILAQGLYVVEVREYSAMEVRVYVQTHAMPEI